MLRTFATALAVAGALFVTAAAGAAEPTVVDQYTEQVPTAGGDRPTDELQPIPEPEEPDGGAALPPSGNGGGTDGTVPPETSGGAANNPGGPDTDGSSPGTAAEPDDGNDIAGTGGTADSDGMGVLFPLILLGCVAVVAVIAIARRRGNPPSRAT